MMEVLTDGIGQMSQICDGIADQLNTSDEPHL